MKKVFLFLVSAWCSQALSQFTKADFETLSQSKGWQKLLHYRHGVSEISPAPFFLHPNGRLSALDELQADVAAFADPKGITQNEEEAPQCRFPARLIFLRKKSVEILHKDIFPVRSCPRFEKWFDTLRGDSVSLIFSSYFLGNPSSTYGHTFLRINKPKGKNGERFPLLDYAVSFAADIKTSNPFVYAYNGILGGFDGSFSVMPYYFKVREYSHFESRDLWEYELNFDKEKTELLVAHTWEVGPLNLGYKYFSFNCSYVILSLLEAVDPDLELTDKLKFYVIPTDTVKVVVETPNLVKKLDYRPSIHSELAARVKDLNDSEIAALKNLVASEKVALPEGVSAKKVLDAAIDYVDETWAFEIQSRNSHASQFKNEILRARSQDPESSPELKVTIPEDQAPHLGHGSTRGGLGFERTQNNGDEILLSYKFAYHDFLDSQFGFPKNAEITFFDLQLDYAEKFKQMQVLHWNLIEVESLNPMTAMKTPLSWGLRVGTDRIANLQCNECEATGVEGRIGWSLQKGPIVFLGLKGDTQYIGQSRLRGLIGAGPELLVLWHISNLDSAMLDGWYRKDFQVHYNEYKEVSLSLQHNFANDFGIRWKGDSKWFENSTSLEFFQYF